MGNQIAEKLREMLKNFLVFSIIIPLFVNAQINETFSDGDFTNNPQWNGDTGQFKINTYKQLQLNSIVADTSCLSVASTSIDSTEWHFYIKLSFNTSSNNNARVYLISDQSDLEGSLNGYFVQVGGTNDSIALYRQSGTNITEIIKGTVAYTGNSTNEIGIKVLRDNSGNWSLFSDPTGGENYQSEGTAADNTFTSTAYFGIFCKYTISNSTKFYFDNFYAGPVIIDTVPPEILSVSVKSQTQVDVSFSENLEETSAETLSNYSVNNGIGNPVTAISDSIDLSMVHLTFASAFANGVLNTLTASGIKDMSDNTVVQTAKTFVYYIPEVSDIAINEVLFNPKDDGVDFVELYNKSDKIIDLKELFFYDESSETDSVKEISSESFLLLPGGYCVLTSSPDKVKEQYFTSNPEGFIEVASMPALNIDEGTVTITDKSNNIIDKFSYTENMHFALLTSVDGVSLERINPDRPAQDSANWHSAAETVGYATPAYKNSQYSEPEQTEDPLTISPEIFSPDNDGYNDVVNIGYKFSEPGYVANVTIYNANGILIKYLVKNELLGTAEGTFSWDGINEDREKAALGIYIIYFEVFDSKGTVKHYKKACVLGGRI